MIDGNYESKLGDTVIGEADTIVWLDLPLPLKLRRVARRTHERIRDDVELWNGNKETWRNAVWTRDSLFALAAEDALQPPAHVARALRRPTRASCGCVRWRRPAEWLDSTYWSSVAAPPGCVLAARA